LQRIYRKATSRSDELSLVRAAVKVIHCGLKCHRVISYPLHQPLSHAGASPTKGETTLSHLIQSIRLAVELIKLIKSIAGMCADENVRRFARRALIGVRHALDSIPTHRRLVVPGSPLTTRLGHWIEAALMCVYVAFMLTVAAVIATVATLALPHWTRLNPLAEPTAFFFIWIVWIAAEFFYKSALVLRSELTGVPML
jgi:hypothetical protein